MYRRTRPFTNFSRRFIHNALYIREVLLGLFSLLLVGAVVISRAEELEFGDALYFACVTGLSIGYGDISPATVLGRITAVTVGLIGMLFVGLTVAIATHALSETIRHDMANKE